MTARIVAHFALFIVALCYGLNFVLAKDVMPQYIEPFGFIFIRVTVALIAFWLVSFFIKEQKRLDKKDLPRIMLCGLFGVGINMLFFFKGLSITGSINASILMMGTPIIVMLLSAYFIKESITRRKGMGVLLGVIGSIIILLLNENLQFAQKTFLGDLFVFLNALSYGLYLVLVKPLRAKYGTMTILRWVFLFGYILIIPFGFQEALDANYRSFPMYIWMEVIFVVLFTTVLTYFLNFYALKHVSPTVVSVYIYFQPLIASVTAIALGKDQLTMVKIVGGIFIFIAVYLVSFRKKQKVNGYM